MTKPLQKWKLPQPTDIKEDNEWIAIPRISRTIPFGYEIDKTNTDQQLSSPLKKTKDSLLINTTNLNKRACFLKIKKIIDKKIK